MSALPPNDPNQNPFTHQEVERWRKGHKPLPMSRDPDRERVHRRQSLIQDAIARVRATQHAYNAPDPPSKRAQYRGANRPRGDFAVDNFASEVITLPNQLYQDSDGTRMGLRPWEGAWGLRSNHDGPFPEPLSGFNADLGPGGLSRLPSTTSNTTVDAGNSGQMHWYGLGPLRQVTPEEVMPTNWVAYFLDEQWFQGGTVGPPTTPGREFEEAVEGWEEEARKRFKRERR